MVEIWKSIIVKETIKNKKNESEPSGSESNGTKSIQRTNSIKNEQTSSNKSIQRTNSIKNEQTSSNKKPKLESSPSVKIEKSEPKVEKPSPVARKPASDPVGPLKLSSMVYCKDPLRDKVREILAEALCKVSSEIDNDDEYLRCKVGESDPYRVAVLVETVMFEKWGKSDRKSVV